MALVSTEIPKYCQIRVILMTFWNRDVPSYLLVILSLTTLISSALLFMESEIFLEEAFEEASSEVMSNVVEEDSVTLLSSAASQTSSAMVRLSSARAVVASTWCVDEISLCICLSCSE